MELMIRMLQVQLLSGAPFYCKDLRNRIQNQRICLSGFCPVFSVLERANEACRLRSVIPWMVEESRFRGCQLVLTT